MNYLLRNIDYLFNNQIFFVCFSEPVLSTGVYIHPSGYSYTVAPNGVWYFHNSDGTPPSSAPGAPPMAYTPTTMQKIQASQTSPTSTTSASRIDKSDDNVGNSSESLSTNVTSSNIPMYQTHGTVHESPPSLAMHSETQYQVCFCFFICV